MLTDDLARVPPRRRAQPGLAGLVHACLIDYPRYMHPEKGAPCPVEAVVAWLSNPRPPQRRSLRNRLLAKLQGVFASKAHLWR